MQYQEIEINTVANTRYSEDAKITRANSTGEVHQQNEMRRA